MYKSELYKLLKALKPFTGKFKIDSDRLIDCFIQYHTITIAKGKGDGGFCRNEERIYKFLEEEDLLEIFKLKGEEYILLNI
ncbi:MAG: hypothetical protein H8D97_00475 [Proteobacteria bacterium]|nr:hypothetical protein [Pseudomonadota bacterium]